MRCVAAFARSVVFVGVVAAASSLAAAGEVHLRWGSVTGATGYRAYVGSSSGVYDRVVDLGAGTAGTIDGLDACSNVYLAVKAYNPAGESPEFSNEVIGWPRPEVTHNDRPLALQGEQLTMNLSGGNFRPGAALEFDAADTLGNPLIHVESLDVSSCAQIQALVTLEPQVPGFRALEIGTHEFRVLNPNGVYGTATVEVALNPERLDINRSSADTRDRVDGKDLVWLAFAHGTGEGEDRFNPDADLNGDGLVDGEDLAYLATQFGACWTGEGWGLEGCLRQATRLR